MVSSCVRGSVPCTVKNCWNHAKTLLRALAVGPVDAVVEELKAILLEMSNSGDVEHLLSDSTKRLTAAAPVESDDEDSELNAAYQAREESDGEEADIAYLG